VNHGLRLDDLKRRYEENPRRFFAPLANEYRKSGDLGLAISLCRQHLAETPANLSGLVVFGQALFEAGELDESRRAFQSATEIDPENLIALRHLGDIAREQDEPRRASEWYRRLLDSDPRNDEVLRILAELDAAVEAESRAAQASDAAKPREAMRPTPPVTDVPDDWTVHTDAQRGEAPIVFGASGADEEPDSVRFTDVPEVSAPPRLSLDFNAALDEAPSFPESEDVSQLLAPEPGEREAPADSDSSHDVVGDDERITDVEPDRIDAYASADHVIGREDAPAIADAVFIAESTAERIEYEAMPTEPFEPDLLSEEHIEADYSAEESTAEESSAQPHLPPALELDDMYTFLQGAGIVADDVDALEVEALAEDVGELAEALAEESEDDLVPELVPELGGDLVEDLVGEDVQSVEEMQEERVDVSDFDPAPIAQETFETATMAELYVRQGLRDKAIGVYRKLVAIKPNDVEIRTRLAQLEAAPADATSGTARAYFAALAVRQPVPRRGAESASPSDEMMETPPGGQANSDVPPGRPARPADDSLSLDSVFRTPSPTPSSGANDAAQQFRAWLANLRKS
jgi:tetratricopeptide (TPR) repeat protein